MGVASDTYAQISRDQYNNWLNRFYPEQQKLLATTTNADLLNEQLGRVDSNFDTSAAAAETATNNQMARYGISNDNSNSNNAATSLAKVSSKNSLRDYESDRSMSTLSGSSLSSLKSTVD